MSPKGPLGARVIAALYVIRDGVYANLPDVVPYALPDRDARTYNGPYPVVAHPPCERWGRYWHGGPSAKVRRVKGDDGGCFAAALEDVRKWGGVLEHPEGSAAWRHFGLRAPPRHGGWVAADLFGGWTCCVEQGYYGHRAAKATWLYAHSVELPSLQWGKGPRRIRLDRGYHTAEERRKAVKRGITEYLSRRERAATPIPFRDLLIAIARTAKPGRSLGFDGEKPGRSLGVAA